MSHEVCVTGMGICGVNGLNTQEFWQNAMALKTGIQTHESFEDQPFKLGGLSGIENHFTQDEKKEYQRYHSRSMIMASRALKEAMQQSCMKSDNLALCLGMHLHYPGEFVYYMMNSGSLNLESQPKSFDIKTCMNYEQDYKKKNPYSALTRENILACCSPEFLIAKIRKILGCKGEDRVINSLCTSSLQAIGEAFSAIRHGVFSQVICGGVEEFSTGAGWTFHNLSLYAGGENPEEACIPFDPRGKGIIAGEGAVFFVLESEESAQERGAEVLAKIAAYGSNNDGHHLIQPQQSGEGLKAVMNHCLEAAGIPSSEIDVVVTHGTGTKHNDYSESAAIRGVFGDLIDEQPFCHSMKSYLGHTLSASGAYNMATAVCEIQNQYVLPTLFFSTAREGCELNYSPPAGISASVKNVVTNASAFGGLNCSLLVKRV